MLFTDTCIYFIIAILGLAYPISLQVVTTLDTKYSSANILDRFKEEKDGKYFTWTLYAALGFTLVHIFWKLFADNSCPQCAVCYFLRDYLLLGVTVLLIVTFLRYVQLVFIYYSPFRLVAHIIAQKDDEQLKGFKCLAEIFYLAIRTNVAPLSKTIHSHFYSLFRDFRNQAGDAEVRYPDDYYQMVYSVILEGATLENKLNLGIMLNVASGRYFLGEHHYSNISQLSYDWLWNNMDYLASVKRDDLTLEYWKNAFSFSKSSIPRMMAKTDKDDPLLELNREEAEKREEEKSKFYEFHYAMGGMLLYYERGRLLKRIFKLKNSSMPSHELIPGSMTEIFEQFVRFTDRGHRLFPFRYLMGDEESIDGEEMSKNWICKYLALTLIRLYTVRSYIYGVEPVSLPRFPFTRAEQKSWLDCMDYLKFCVREVQGDISLMRETDLSVVTTSYCKKNGFPTPVEIIEQAKAKLELICAAKETDQGISTGKQSAFEQRSGEVITKFISGFAGLRNENSVLKSTEIKIAGVIDFMPKEAFADDQGTSYVDFDRRLAKKLCRKIEREITKGFSGGIAESYLFKGKELFVAIAILNPDPKQFVLLNFGLPIKFLLQRNEIAGLAENSFRGIPIIEAMHFDNRIIRSSLLLVEKSKLPFFDIKDLEGEEIERFDFRRISSELPLYASVIDLHARPEFKSELRVLSEQTLERSVLMKIGLNMEVFWPKQSSYIEFKLHSTLVQQGEVNSLDELKPLQEGK